jgi:tetratricopeptide (TPR) repeat protein
LDAAVTTWKTEHVDTFGPLLSEDVLATKSSEQIDALAGSLVTLPNRVDDAVRVIERGLEADPGSFRLHYLAGALGFMQVKAVGEIDEATADKAMHDLLHHIQVATALRPKSAFVRAMLAMALAINRRFEEAVQCIDAATALEPDNALIWLFKARFYSYSPDPRPGVEACRRALSIDPKLGGVNELMQQLQARSPGR